MAFTLDTSVLGPGSFRTVPTDLAGPFRDLQIRFYENTAGGDLEIHFIELHFTLGGVSREQT